MQGMARSERDGHRQNEKKEFGPRLSTGRPPKTRQHWTCIRRTYSCAEAQWTLSFLRVSTRLRRVPYAMPTDAIAGSSRDGTPQQTTFGRTVRIISQCQLSAESPFREGRRHLASSTRVARLACSSTLHLVSLAGASGAAIGPLAPSQADALMHLSRLASMVPAQLAVGFAFCLCYPRCPLACWFWRAVPRQALSQKHPTPSCRLV